MTTTILFDIDDTLLDNYAAFSTAVQTVFLKRPLSSKEMIRLYGNFRKNSEKVFEQFHVDVMRDPEKKFQRWAIISELLAEKYNRTMLKQLDDRYHNYQKQLRLSEEFLDLLEYLKQKKLQLGVLSNGLYDKQKGKIEQLGIKEYINPEYIFVSERLGESKPNLRCYQKVERSLPASVDRIIYLGDSYINDILPSHKAGWLPIWLNRFEEKANTTGIIEAKTVSQAIRHLKEQLS